MRYKLVQSLEYIFKRKPPQARSLYPTSKSQVGGTLKFSPRLFQKAQACL